ncbi:MAG: undecaprenyl/decaprenyl-phosphate alpha-N-acetylglucosaminyl 1-phosphate transferase [Planctomycetota bacterium]|nr:MAG: undecaprenyl/decaprenyl-phosphate alpha-N-acetylglucosaminyl 1-phosphate transferase [Planctomycetota bacterium]
MLPHLGALLASFVLALIFTPCVRSFAIRWGITDEPDDRRKLHRRTVARAGGTAVLLAVLVVCVGAFLTFDVSSFDVPSLVPFAALLVGMLAIWALGLADDIWTLRGRQKLVGQILVATLLASAGYSIRSVQFMGWTIELGVFSLLASVVWLLGTTNALNLIDGADGLCSTLGAIICGSLGILSAVHGHFAESAIAFALCGALLGFLVFNFPPASIFLGDSGSMLVGMVAGALAIRCSLKGPAGVAFLAPMAILALPLMDSVMAIVRRTLTGRSIYTTDRAHLHHTLRNRGLNDIGLLMVVAGLSLLTAGAALAGAILEMDWLGPASVGLVFAGLVASKAFGYAEMVLIAKRGTHFALSLVGPASKSKTEHYSRAVHMQGTRNWETVWLTLIEFAEREDLKSLQLDLNVPWLEEGFHAVWKNVNSGEHAERDERWSTALPIRADGRVVGRLNVAGAATSQQSLSALSRLVELIEDLAPQIELVMYPEMMLPPECQVDSDLPDSSRPHQPAAASQDSPSNDSEPRYGPTRRHAAVEG